MVTKRRKERRESGSDAENGKKRRRRSNRRRSRRSGSAERPVRRETNENRHSALISDERGGDDAVASASNEISLSVEESNKLRAQLGLAPLEVQAEVKIQDIDDQGVDGTVGKLITVDGSQFVHKPALSLTDKKHEDAMREKLQTLQQKRLLLDKFRVGKQSTETADDDESAAAWVMKSRRLEEMRRLAEKREREFDEVDEQLSKSALPTATEKPGRAAELSAAGLTVRHSKEEFLEGRETVLVLEDKDVLDESDDVLINPTIVEQEKWRRNVENKMRKPDYNPFENDEFDQMGLPQEKIVLKKYDEVLEGEKKESFRLGADGTAEVTRELELARLRQELMKGAQSLEAAPMQPAREYYTPEEMAKFKKPKKRVKVQRRRHVETLIDEIAVPEESDYGSRARGKGLAKDSGDEPSPSTEIQEDEKPSVAQMMSSALATDKERICEPQLNDIVIEDEAEKELQMILSRARRAKLEERARDEFKLTAEKVVELTRNGGSGEPVPSTSNLVFDAVSEYCRGLGENLMDGRSAEDAVSARHGEGGGKKERKPDTTGTWVEAEFFNPPKKESSSSESDEEADGNPILEAEPEASKSVAEALRLASQKGYLERSNKGSGEVLRLAHLKAKKYTIMDRQFHDIDDKYAKKLERMGSAGGGPVVDFKEKKGYQPDVKLEYPDETGRLMDAKDAFRYLSWKFHGKKPGKKKLEKRAKKILEAKLMNQMSSTDTPLHTLEKQLDKQKQTKSAYIVLSGGTKKDGV